MQRLLRARFLALTSPGPVEKYRDPRSHTATSGVTWGRPSGRTVDTQNTPDRSRARRAVAHGVAVAFGLL
jgi:hypothetical protein